MPREFNFIVFFLDKKKLSALLLLAFKIMINEFKFRINQSLHDYCPEGRNNVIFFRKTYIKNLISLLSKLGGKITKIMFTSY